MTTPAEFSETRKTTPPLHPVRVLLDHETSEILRDLGPCFAVLSPATYPDNPRRVALHAIPSTVALIDRAVAVAQGKLGTRKLPTR